VASCIAYIEIASIFQSKLIPLWWTDLERELVDLKREEAKLVRDIKAAAKVGNQAGMRVLAKSLVRLRGQQTKLHASIAQLRGVKTSITVSVS
jgi:division protein CdvB (Snf7/Vps24/ESCRT-III family)